MQKIEYKERNYRYQIVANTGETLGCSVELYETAERIIDEIIQDAKLGGEYLRELCPDSDLSEITSLEIQIEEE